MGESNLPNGDVEPEDGDPTAWFDALYRAADSQTQVPWADGRPNPHLLEWLESTDLEAKGQTLVVGCGLGDDAVELASRGFDVTAFDVSPTAIAWCRDRFPTSSVRFQTTDLFDPPASWSKAFDLVVEVYTLQSLPDDTREQALAAVASFVSPGGILVVIARGREPDEPADGPPWPLTRAELRAGESHGLTLVQFDDYADPDRPAIRQFRATFERPPH